MKKAEIYNGVSNNKKGENESTQLVGGGAVMDSRIFKIGFPVRL